MDPDAGRRVRVGDRSRAEGLSHALDADARDALRLAQGQGVGLVILHPVDLDEEVLVVRVGAFGAVGDTIAVRVDLHAEREVDGSIAVEVDAARLPAVRKAVTVLFIHPPLGAQRYRQTNCACWAAGFGASRETRR